MPWTSACSATFSSSPKNCTSPAPRRGLAFSRPRSASRSSCSKRTLGAQLFRRKPRGVELTEAGLALRNEAASIFASVERAVDTVVRVSRGEQGDIRIGLTTSACFHPLPPQRDPLVPARQSAGEDRSSSKTARPG